MNWDQIEGNWKQFKGKVQQQWGDLTDDDLDQLKGNQQELEGVIQKRYGKSREEAKKMVDDWMTTAEPPASASRDVTGRRRADDPPGAPHRPGLPWRRNG